MRDQQAKAEGTSHNDPRTWAGQFLSFTWWVFLTRTPPQLERGNLTSSCDINVFRRAEACSEDICKLFFSTHKLQPNGTSLDLITSKMFKDKHYGSTGGATSGLTSSFAFAPVQGIELSNPQAHAHQLGSGTQITYFSETGTFSNIKRIWDILEKFSYIIGIDSVCNTMLIFTLVWVYVICQIKSYVSYDASCS